MSWFSLEVQAPVAQREAVAAWLVARTGQAVEERPDGTLISFAANLEGALSLERELAREHGAVIACARQELPDVDWTTAWRAGLGVRRVGRFAIVPTWVAYQPGADEIVLRLDPEMAFGSGEHGSTRAALALLERAVRPGDFVMDLGSGSGILSIAAVKLGAVQAVGIEVDGDTIPIAIENLARNEAADRVVLLEGDAAQMAPLLPRAQVIVSNILRLVNVALLPEIRDALAQGGCAIFSGMELAEADLFRGPLAAGGFAIQDEVVDEGWWAVRARRR
jgi:ribosomal protein L11 methyltransferase